VALTDGGRQGILVEIARLAALVSIDKEALMRELPRDELQRKMDDGREAIEAHAEAIEDETKRAFLFSALDRFLDVCARMVADPTNLATALSELEAALQDILFAMSE